MKHGLPVTVEVVLDPDAFLDEGAVRRAAAKAAGIPLTDIRAVRVKRRAIDARRGRVVISARVELADDELAAPRLIPAALPALHGLPRVVIVGCGPAGLFCAWGLAKAGIRSIVVDRGKAVRDRRRDVAALSTRGQLAQDSNYCFGEGGAGTFSDGKLYTRSEKRGPVRDVLEALVAYGAPADILIDARPHIGTNRLPRVISTMREHLADAGVQIRFDSRVTRIVTGGARVQGVELADGTVLDAAAVVVATGHSARDVYDLLADIGAPMSFKPFALGVRLEHSQASIDRLQFGKWAGHPALGAASYRMVERCGQVSVFSFCMCPGGHMVPAATEPDGHVVNGWSPSSRRGRFANSGFVAEVSARQLAEVGFDPSHASAGIDFQRHFERLAFIAGGGSFVGPAQRVPDLIAGRPSVDLPDCSYPRGIVPARLDVLLGPIAEPIRAALDRIGRRMPAYVSSDALAVGVESRTSSPVRIERDRETLQSPTIASLYPCAEGAGYAGGIMSAALDGLRIADAIVRG